jgi:hypothetical protein
VCYNDAPPANDCNAKTNTDFGHCKGILAWSKDRLGWLVHSVPLWPEKFSNEAVSPLVDSGIRCGQSFLWLEMEWTDSLAQRIMSRVAGAASSFHPSVPAFDLQKYRPP